MTTSWPRPTDFAVNQVAHVDEHNAINTALNELHAWVEEGTGERDVSGLLKPAWTLDSALGRVLLRRYGGRAVSLSVRIKRVTASGSRATPSVILALPPGFRPHAYVDALGPAAVTAPGEVAALATSGDPGDVCVVVPSDAGIWAAGDTVGFDITFTTPDAAPTLPYPGI